MKPEHKNAMGRPRGAVFTQLIHSRLPKTTYEEIQTLATAQGLSSAAWIRVACMKVLAESKKVTSETQHA